MLRLGTAKLCLGLSALSIPAVALAAQPQPAGVLFTEHFDDADLPKRSWYDGSRFRIAGGALADNSCLEYEWADGQSKPGGSSGVRRLFEPTDEIAIRFYLKLSKGWGWTGRNYHPHLWIDELAIGTKRPTPLAAPRK